MLLRSDITLEVRRPVFASRISAGFPSPADDFIEGSLDLNKHLVAHPAATFFLRVVGRCIFVYSLKTFRLPIIIFPEFFLFFHWA